MMSLKNVLICSSLFAFLTLFSACNHVSPPKDADVTVAVKPQEEPLKAAPTQPAIAKNIKQQGSHVLPIMYQTPSYMVGDDAEEVFAKDDITSLKVGASIRSTRGPQPLWDILKRLASLKKMNVSWASDVDQDVLVDVDISANDDFYESIDNLLRQVDYYHTMEGNTIVVKYKETKRFHIAMPFTKQTYSTGTGGNVLGGDDTSGNIDGTIQINSEGNEFDIWKNIQENMDAIIDTWNTKAYTPTAAQSENAENADTEEEIQAATRRVSTGDSMYIIDRHIGMITVTAPRPLLDRLDNYFTALKSEMYKQITIEAKIIEVELNDTSTIGINWSSVLKDFPVNGSVSFGDSGQIWPSNGEDFISTITLNTVSFGAFLNALKEQGNTKILSNPKLSVMNGQPALINVGRNVTYIDEIESDIDTENGIITYSTETERVMSGVGMALTATVLDDSEIIMNLVPVTSELEEPIRYEDIGTSGAQVGLPVINVREMSTTVKVKSGEMLVIGGLISNTDQDTSEFAPVVGDVPLLKYLFGYEEKVKRKSELIILLKPRII